MVEAKLDADVGGRGRSDGVLGDLDVVGGGEGAGSDDVDGGGGGFGGVGLAGGGDGGVKAGRAAGAGVVAAGVDRAGRGDDGRAAEERRASDGPGDAGGIAGGGERDGLADAHGGNGRSESEGDGGLAVPETLMTWGELGALSVRVRVSERGPVAVGTKVTVDGARAEVGDRGGASIGVGEITGVAATGGDGRDCQSAGAVVGDGDHHGRAGDALVGGWKGDGAGRKCNGRRGSCGGRGVTATTASREKNQRH